MINRCLKLKREEGLKNKGDMKKQRKEYLKRNLLLVVKILGALLILVGLRGLYVYVCYTNVAPIEKTVNYLPLSATRKLPPLPDTLQNQAQWEKKEEELPSEKVMFVFYKIGCPFCEVAHQAIEQQSKGKSNVFFVEVTTPLGRQLVAKFGIKHSSTTVVTEVKKSKNPLFVLYPQAKVNQEGERIPDQLGIDRAFRFLDS